MNKPKYIVVSSCDYDDAKICGKGVADIYVTDTLSDAQAYLDSIVKDRYFDYVGRTFEKNTPYGDDFCECDSVKRSAYFWGNTSAWIRAHLECWERVEIFEYDPILKKHINLS